MEDRSVVGVALGTETSSSTTVGGYVKLHKRIWAMPSAFVPEPTDEDRQQVWAVRVGLLDTDFYQPRGAE